MKTSWWCRIGLHKWIVVKEYTYMDDAYIGYETTKDKVCIRSDCNAYRLGVARRLKLEEAFNERERVRNVQWLERENKRLNIRNEALLKLQTLVQSYR